MLKWEYKVLWIDNFYQLENELNDLGDDGWELVGQIEVEEIVMSYRLIFKRPQKRNLNIKPTP